MDCKAGSPCEFCLELAVKRHVTIFRCGVYKVSISHNTTLINNSPTSISVENMF